MGLNFLAMGYAHSQGGLSTDPSLPLTDAHLKIDTGVVAYVRGIDLWGNSGKFDVIVPYSHLSGTALVAGQPRERDISGAGDPRFRLSRQFLRRAGAHVGANTPPTSRTWSSAPACR